MLSWIPVAALSALASSPTTTPQPTHWSTATVERLTFSMLRPVDQMRIAERSHFELLSLAGGRSDSGMTLVPRSSIAALNTQQREFLATLESRLVDGRAVPAMCFTPDTEPGVVAAFQRFIERRGDRFQQAGRWSQTATQPGPLNQGDVTVLTYSFVPDGTIVPNYTATSPSALFAFLNGIYGTPATWQAVYAQVFQRWADLSGTSYVFEPNDDGVAMDDPGVPASGILGVRGDCRMAGTPIDGNSGILAFNYYPAPDAGGDMVIDTNDNFYSDTSGSNIKLRNVLAHEHGHGLGMAHVCPRTNSKLMEPFISTVFDGPQIDEILNAQRHYGDNLEPNDTSATASTVASISTPVSITPVSIDGASDVDWYSITPPNTGVTTIDISPLGGTYADNGQDSLCTAQGHTNYSSASQLWVDVFDAPGTTLLLTRTAPAGSPIKLRTPTTTAALKVRVRGGASDVIQGYTIAFSHTAGQAIVIDLPSGNPANVNTMTTTTFLVGIQSHAALSGTPTISYSMTGPGSAFSTFPLVLVSPGVYQATLPRSPLCALARFRVSAASGPTGTVVFPGPLATDSLIVPFGTSTSVIADDFSTGALDWRYGIVGDTATAGIWLRGDPNGSSGQPENAASEVNCAFTGQALPTDGAGVNDVDNGFTTLVSPEFSLVARSSPTISYNRWFCNSAGANPAAKTFRVDISNNGGTTWTNLETVGPGGPGIWGGWITASVAVPTSVALTANMRVRFVADDSGTGAVYEAAVDDFSASGVSCAPGLVSDANSSNTVTVQDVFDFLSQWFGATIGGDVTGDGGVTVQDIFAFLAAWFASA